MKNALTIDVEDYFMVSAFADIVKFEDWGNYESRIERNTFQFLDILDAYKVKATFFTLGWVAEHYPGIVRDVHERGHEIASHGYNHRLVYNLSPDEFREDTRKAKKLLEDIIGEPVYGYRAASYSITEKSMWALDILIEEGFTYDSSIFPIHHDRYGYSKFSRFPDIVTRGNGSILEIPLSTYRFAGKNMPIAGGGYLRLLPLWFIKQGIKSLNRKENQPAILYLHPWELDHGQPRLNGGKVAMFRHYVNLGTTAIKINQLLEEFRFGPVRDVYATHLAEF